MATKFTTWFPNTEHGPLNPIDFGAFGDNVSRPLSGLTAGQAPNAPYLGNLTLAQSDYPSATALTDTADWCAITECWKQAFTTGGVPNTDAWKNRPVAFSPGKYIINKSLRLTHVEGAHIYGMGGTGSVMIFNETGPTGTAAQTSCVIADGLSYSRIENIAFNCRGGSNSVSFDIGPPGGTFNSHGNLFINCDFINRSGGIGCQTSAGFMMGSEITWIRCQFVGLSGDEASVGCHIVGDNALNYQLLACAGDSNSLAWLRVSSGGMVVVQNGSLASNGTKASPTSADIQILAGEAVILGTRTESRRFVNAAGSTTLIACEQTWDGNDGVLVNADGSAMVIGCKSISGRFSGTGKLTLHGNSLNLLELTLLTVTNNAGEIQITHNPSPLAAPPHNIEYFLDGDEVIVSRVGGTGGPSINGIWNIRKINSTTIVLKNSVFGGTYENIGPGPVVPPYDKIALFGNGPHNHLRDVNTNPAAPRPLQAQTMPTHHRHIQESYTRNREIGWSESGIAFDNNLATGTVTFTLPFIGSQGGRNISGNFFEFIVVAAQTLRVVVSPESMGAQTSSRIYEAGGYHSGAGGWGTEIFSNQPGASLRLYMVDPGIETIADPAHRWLVTAKTGTWTISGTPA